MVINFVVSLFYFTPIDDVQVFFVEVKLHAIYCCIEVAEYPSDLLPVVLV